MNRSTTRTALERIGVGFVLICVLVLLTLIFSVLGTISCAVILGMMMGGARRWGWQAVMVSLIFPPVILGLSQFSSALSWRQSILMSAVCFGAFWGMYALTRGLLLLEGKNPAQDPSASGTTELTGEGTLPGELMPEASSLASTRPPIDSELDALQGKWCCEFGGQPGEAFARVIEITRARVKLSVVGCQGQVPWVAQGDLRVQKVGQLHTLRIVNLDPIASMPAEESKIAASTWVYGVNGQSLTIACHFNAAAAAKESNPILLIYRKIK